jgi:predicted DNA-binding transcriptional regulator YafY
VLKAGAWYMVARGSQGVRTFKVSQIHALEVQDATFARPADFDLPAYWAKGLERFEAGLRPRKASLRASPAGLKRLSRLGAYAARAVQDKSAPGADGWARLRLPIENVDQAALDLLGLGPDVEVLEPAALRARLRELAQRVARRHR